MICRCLVFGIILRLVCCCCRSGGFWNDVLRLWNGLILILRRLRFGRSCLWKVRVMMSLVFLCSVLRCSLKSLILSLSFLVWMMCVMCFLW